jgi:hypothetical protein
VGPGREVVEPRTGLILEVLNRGLITRDRQRIDVGSLKSETEGQGADDAACVVLLPLVTTTDVDDLDAAADPKTTAADMALAVDSTATAVSATAMPASTGDHGTAGDGTDRRRNHTAAANRTADVTNRVTRIRITGEARTPACVGTGAASQMRRNERSRRRCDRCDRRSSSEARERRKRAGETGTDGARETRTYSGITRSDGTRITRTRKSGTAADEARRRSDEPTANSTNHSKVAAEAAAETTTAVAVATAAEASTTTVVIDPETQREIRRKGRAGSEEAHSHYESRKSVVHKSPQNSPLTKSFT